jgi:uncharacterized membrane protein
MIELIALWFIVSIVVGVVIGRSIHVMNIGDMTEDLDSPAATADFPFFPQGSSLGAMQAR